MLPGYMPAAMHFRDVLCEPWRHGVANLRLHRGTAPDELEVVREGEEPPQLRDPQATVVPVERAHVRPGLRLDRRGWLSRRTGTTPEVLLRSALHRRGLRFRRDYLVRAAGVRVRPGGVSSRSTAAVFVDGCVWHQCPEHSGTPTRNLEY